MPESLVVGKGQLAALTWDEGNYDYQIYNQPHNETTLQPKSYAKQMVVDGPGLVYSQFLPDARGSGNFKP